MLKAFGLMMLLAAAPAFGQTVVNFGPAASCPTYYTGFTTDNSGVTVDWINSWYNGTTLISINGAVFRGPAAFSVTSSCGTRCEMEQETNVPRAIGRPQPALPGNSPSALCRTESGWFFSEARRAEDDPFCGACPAASRPYGGFDPVVRRRSCFTSFPC